MIEWRAGLADRLLLVWWVFVFELIGTFLVSPRNVICLAWFLLRLPLEIAAACAITDPETLAYIYDATCRQCESSPLCLGRLRKLRVRAIAAAK